MHFSKIIAAAFLAAPLIGSRPTGGAQPSSSASGFGSAFPSASFAMSSGGAGGRGGHHSGGAQPTGSSNFGNGRAKQSGVAQVSGKSGSKGGKGGKEGASGSGFGGASMTVSSGAKPTGRAKPSGHQRRQKNSAVFAPGGEMQQPTGSAGRSRPTGARPFGAAPSGFGDAAAPQPTS
ncbi:uncharacterized protein EAF01_007811 [Botrytis porri]|uniref:uncharacterized protein n=1 Tax=Botrytis porri TaxID=87229 RepID=UPI001901C2A0|nr:uncharacterized protein EAF01_007811 [Botrytis porri]KAF7900509.1 hypothetical protein EAF01_007811 [Botrytis porri]